MSTHTTISASQVREAARASGATELAVRRALLGLPVPADARKQIVEALADLGVDRDFLERLAGTKPGTTAEPPDRRGNHHDRD